jgi:cobalt/nickel transport system ATP-binding protein
MGESGAFQADERAGGKALVRAVEIRGLHFSYPDGTVALRGIDLEVSAGESLGLIGCNGAGKSTLLLHLNGILKGSAPVKILGDEVSDKTLSRIRARVGMIFQDPDNQLFMPTVADDVGFGPVNMGMSREAVEQAVARALAQVDMLGFEERSPHHMSVGEKKRASIATVLSMRPEILALDEPSSNLDPRHRRDLINLLNSLELTKIISSHDLGFVRETCTRVAVMDGGKIATVGRTGEILGDGDLLKAAGILV